MPRARQQGLHPDRVGSGRRANARSPALADQPVARVRDRRRAIRLDQACGLGRRRGSGRRSPDPFDPGRRHNDGVTPEATGRTFILPVFTVAAAHLPQSHEIAQDGALPFALTDFGCILAGAQSRLQQEQVARA
jgi:hypothetical protein